eukprot:1331743-Pleurochrysis_carterae.AAC.3
MTCSKLTHIAPCVHCARAYVACVSERANKCVACTCMRIYTHSWLGRFEDVGNDLLELLDLLLPRRLLLLVALALRADADPSHECAIRITSAHNEMMCVWGVGVGGVGALDHVLTKSAPCQVMRHAGLPGHTVRRLCELGFPPCADALVHAQGSE